MAGIAEINAHPLPQVEGFDGYWENEIAPELDNLEEARKEAMGRVKRGILIAVLGVAGFLLSAVFADNDSLTLLGFLLAFFIAPALVVYGIIATMRAHMTAKHQLKGVVVAKTCAFLGYGYQISGFEFPLDQFTGAKILPAHSSRSLQDRIVGTRDGVTFELCEARLTRSGTDSGSTTVFNGLLLVFSFPKRFAGQTVVAPDAKWLGNMLGGLGRTGERVALVDPRFEERFTVYSTDQVEARYLLSPTFMERLMYLEESFDKPEPSQRPSPEYTASRIDAMLEAATQFSDGLRRSHRQTTRLTAAFADDHLLIAVRTARNMFEAGKLSEPAALRSRADELLFELEQVLDIIDTLNLTDTSRI